MQNINKSLLAVFIVCLAAIGGILIKNHMAPHMPNSAQSVPHVFSTDTYSITVPGGWAAYVNGYVPTNTLFGPDASTSSQSSHGGIEVYPGQASLDAYMKDVEGKIGAKFTDAKDMTTASGISGKSAYLEVAGQPSVYVTSLFKDGTVYSIFFRPEASGELEKYEAVVQSFKLVSTTQ